MRSIDFKCLNLTIEESRYIINFIPQKRGVSTEKLLSTIKPNLKRKNNEILTTKTQQNMAKLRKTQQNMAKTQQNMAETWQKHGKNTTKHGKKFNKITKNTKKLNKITRNTQKFNKITKNKKIS